MDIFDLGCLLSLYLCPKRDLTSDPVFNFSKWVDELLIDFY